MTQPPKEQFDLPDDDGDDIDEGVNIDSSPIGDMPVLASHTDTEQLRHLVTPLRTLEQQVGSHVVHALQTENTVAVVTAVVNTPDGQRIISAALDPQQMQLVQDLLGEAAQQREERIPCVGFHCFLEPKKKPASDPPPKPRRPNDNL